MSIVTEWEIKSRLMPRSAELKTLDGAVKTWATKGQGIGDANMKAVWTGFQAWKAAQLGEYNKIKVAADGLQTELAAKWSAMPTQIAGVGASAVTPKGWNLVAYNPATHGGALLPAAQHVAALTSAEITRMNEAIRRVKVAISGARDAALQVAKRKNFTAPMPTEEQAYTHFFGAYDATRLQKIVDNFRALAMAFDGAPNFIDVRNRVQWAHTYGGCVRRNLVVKSAQKVMSLSGAVQMLFGRAFLGTGSYEKTTDDTIATLVHEFAHGVLNAVDVPDVDNAGTFQCTRVSDDPNHADFGNSTDPFGHQCSTEAMDKVLAQFQPAYAIVNADNYGQFTKALLIANRG